MEAVPPMKNEHQRKWLLQKLVVEGLGAGRVGFPSDRFYGQGLKSGRPMLTVRSEIGPSYGVCQATEKRR
jgi:hypothetical protein